MLQSEQVLQGRYQLKQQLGSNVARQTWLAQDLATQTQKLVIVKLLPFSPNLAWENLKLFEREAQVLKYLNHPYIPEYQDYFASEPQQKGELPWFGLVQNYIQGNSLQQLLNNGKQFTESEVKRIATQLLKILIYLHELSPRVLHRDIKPSNIILGNDQQIYLVDFGAVQDRAKAEGVTFTVVGTGGYAPPEQLWGRAVPASDLYALGATLIHLLTGTAPADLPQKKMRLQFREQVSLSPRFAYWLEKITDPAPERRFSSARTALEVLQSQSVVNFSLETIGINTRKTTEKDRNFALPIFLLVCVFLVDVFLSLLAGSHLCGMACKNKQAEGKTYVGSMNRAQQAYWVENSKFSNSLEKLDLSISSQTDNYEYSTRVTETTAYNYGVSRKFKLKSYVGSVVPAYISSTGEMTTVSILCEAERPGKMRPPDPILRNAVLECAPGTKDLSK